MVFSSSVFLFCFLPIMLITYYLIKIEFRNILLLISSLFFYAWGEPKFVFVILVSIIINYSFGFLITFGSNPLVRKIIMLLGVFANCGILFYFKYFDFFLSSTNNLLGLDLPLKHVMLPIGISFFTFQGLSYILDIYWGKVEFQKNFIKFALFKAFFPQLIAGPIVRYVDVHDQIDKRNHTLDDFAYGVRRFILGLGKKVIIANSMGQVTDNIFALPADQNTLITAWLGAICYAFQIYFDFSGYSDMAIGLARMFGFKFKENFDFPYVSKSITIFWRKWHISLSSWFRDYLYIPLGGNRRGNVYLNLLIVFFVTGLWHGAAWNFVIWGLWHGLFLIIERILKRKGIEINSFGLISWLYTTVIVLIGWVLFRAADIHYGIKYLQIMFGIIKPTNVGFNVNYYLDPMVVTILIIACVASLPLTKYIKKNVGEYQMHTSFSKFIQNFYVIVLLLICMMFLATSTYNPFIYFRF